MNQENDLLNNPHFFSFLGHHDYQLTLTPGEQMPGEHIVVCGHQPNDVLVFFLFVFSKSIFSILCQNNVMM